MLLISYNYYGTWSGQHTFQTSTLLTWFSILHFSQCFCELARFEFCKVFAGSFTHFSDVCVYFFVCVDGSSPGYCPSIDSHLMELCLAGIKCARKKGNIVLASRLLNQWHDGTIQDQEQHSDLGQAFRLLSLKGTVGEKWGSDLQIEKAKVLRAAGKKQRRVLFFFCQKIKSSMLEVI